MSLRQFSRSSLFALVAASAIGALSAGHSTDASAAPHLRRFHYVTASPLGYWFFTNIRSPYFVYPVATGYSFLPYQWPVVRRPSFGAIVYSRSEDTFHGAWGYPNAPSAFRAARFSCDYSADCWDVVWVQNGCAAVATDNPTNVLGAGIGLNLGQARSRAEKACRQSGGVRCAVRKTVCSF